MASWNQMVSQRVKTIFKNTKNESVVFDIRFWWRIFLSLNAGKLKWAMRVIKEEDSPLKLVWNKPRFSPLGAARLLFGFTWNLQSFLMFSESHMNWSEAASWRRLFLCRRVCLTWSVCTCSPGFFFVFVACLKFSMLFPHRRTRADEL